ncbi:MAG: hypothetical protein R3251_02955 [Candidatus Spechtbacterales bacterium]|nr:hypothetical protein [Candidatus Spechtbacterales bacterium]
MANFAHAQTLNIDYPAIPIPGPNGVIYFDLDDVVEAEKATLIVIIIYAYATVIWLAAILAFTLLIYIGFVFIYSGSSASARRKAKERFYNLSWGVLIIILSWFLLNIINPNITDIEQSLLFQIVSPGGEVYEGFAISTKHQRDPNIAGTYSCEWDGSSCSNKEPNNCNVGYFPGNCSGIDSGEPDSEEFCTDIQNEPCYSTFAFNAGEGGGGGSLDCPPPDGCTTYDAFATFARQFTTPAPGIKDGQTSESQLDPKHQTYVNTEPLSNKDHGVPDCFGADCGTFVGTVVRNTIDPDFPARGTSNIQNYFNNAGASKYTYINNDPLDQSKLRAGDILLSRTIPGHVSIWLDDSTGTGEYEAAIKGRGGAGDPIQCDESTLPHGPENAPGSNMVKIYRFNGFIQ